jgi:hypothetical protein
MTRDPKFRYYRDCEKHFANVRTPSKGKPLKGWCRLFKEGEDFVVRLQRWSDGLEYFRISPENTLTFSLPSEQIHRHAHTLVNSTGRVIPIDLVRWKKGIYRVCHEREFMDHHPESESPVGRSYPAWNRDAWRWFKSDAPQYFAGMQFDLNTGTCINPQPDQSVEVIPEQRKIWLRQLKRYKHGLKARAKVGALTVFIDEENTWRGDKNRHWQERNERKPDWSDPVQRSVLVQSMKGENYSEQILRAFVAAVPGHRLFNYLPGHQRITQQDVLETVDRVFTAESESLRREYGVFGETFHAKT